MPEFKKTFIEKLSEKLTLGERTVLKLWTIINVANDEGGYYVPNTPVNIEIGRIIKSYNIDPRHVFKVLQDVTNETLHLSGISQERITEEDYILAATDFENFVNSIEE